MGIPKMVSKMSRFFRPKLSNDMKFWERHWHWDRVKGWITVCNHCGAHHCQCGEMMTFRMKLNSAVRRMS